MEKTSGSSESTPPMTHSEHLQVNHPRHDYRQTSIVGQPAYQEHGPLVDHRIPQDEEVQSEPDLLWSRIRRYLREPFSEFFGVFILIMFGDGVVAQVVLSNETKGSE
ncbi:aquaglyceroporin like other eukaryote [Lasallia pustulata]|uniref:Aquaglyceroporin like other eukaryote n=1 Tax=Lasallia pustulata TaxID=136370 RepID=A0A1W5D4N4_9LECA|nr:aquaglyceroporin like other eukaryote [Lasallia pustulata]